MHIVKKFGYLGALCLGSLTEFAITGPKNWLQMLVHVPKTGNVSTLPSQVHSLYSWIKNKVTFILQCLKVQVHNNVYQITMYDLNGC